MPPRSAKELRRIAGNSNFMTESNEKYKAVQQFQQKLLNLQDAMKSGGDMQLREQVGKLAGGIMALQLHAVSSDEALEQAIGDMTFSLPGFLKKPRMGGDEKTGYEQLVEAGQQYGAFTREELDEALNLIGQGLDVDMGVPAPEKAKEEPDARYADNAKFRGWALRYNESLKNSEKGFRPQVDEVEIGKSEQYAFDSLNPELRRELRNMGILDSYEDVRAPESNGVPRVFLFKDGKLSTPEENGFDLRSPEFTKAVMKGQVFVYPAGLEHPVQLQGTIEGTRSVNHSEPLRGGSVKLEELKLPQEPKVSAEPRWYHRWFKFWGDNRKICEDYATTTAAHDQWKAKCEKLQQDQERAKNSTIPALTAAVAGKFGPKRTKEARQAELQKSFEIHDAARREKNRKELVLAEKNAKAIEDGIDIVRNVYAAQPELKQEYVDSRLYNAEHFKILTKAEIDPEMTKIEGHPVSKEEFAALALFAAMDPKNGIKTFEKNKGVDAGPMIQSMEKEGYSKEAAEKIMSKAGVGMYTLDVIRKEGRMSAHFDIGMNSGRKKAEEALKAYPQDKTKLADILVNVVSEAGELAGSTGVRSGEYVGVQGVVKLGKDMIELMERDRELQAMVKAKYEAQDKAFCKEVNGQISKYLPEHKNVLKPRSFEKSIQSIKDFAKYTEIQQAGLEARKKLAQARAEDGDLKPAEKKACIKDILKAQMTEALYEKEQDERAVYQRDNGVNGPRRALEKYKDELSKKVAPQLDDDDDEPELQIPADQQVHPLVPSVAISGLDTRFTDKAPILSMMSKQEELDTLDKQAERIMEEDGLAALDPESLLGKFEVAAGFTATYSRENMILRATKLNAPAKEQGGEQKQIVQDKNEIGKELPQPGEDGLQII